MTRILIAGCGEIGTELGLKLAEQGNDVWGLRRNADRIPAPIKSFQADMTAFESLKGIPRYIDKIVIILTADLFDDSSYHATYVESTRNLLMLLRTRKENPKQIFFTSSTSVYGQTNGEWVDESSPTTPQHFSGSRILEAERLLRESPFSTTCIRLAGIYGPRRTRFIDQVRNRKLSCTLDSPLYRNLIHQDDVIGILLHLFSLPQLHPIYNGVDCEPVRRNDLILWASRKVGVSAAKARELEFSISKRSFTNKRCSNARIVQSGYTYLYPSYREGYGEIIEGINQLRTKKFGNSNLTL